MSHTERRNRVFVNPKNTLGEVSNGRERRGRIVSAPKGQRPQAISEHEVDDFMRSAMELHSQSVVWSLRRRGVGPEEAEDILQETLIRVLRNRQQFDSPDAIRGWMGKVAARINIDAARARRARPQEVDATFLDTKPDLTDDYERVNSNNILKKVLVSLPQGQRDAVLLVHYLGYSIAEVAEILGIPVGTVKSRVFNGLRQLRELLDSPDTDK